MARGRGRGRGDWSMGTPGGIQEITYTVPADKCGLVIGKGKRPLLGFLFPSGRVPDSRQLTHVNLRSMTSGVFAAPDGRCRVRGVRCLLQDPCLA